MGPFSIEGILAFANLLLASTNVIIGFSLFVYVLTHNRKSSAAQAFCALVAFVTLAYVVEITMPGVATLDAAYLWLRVQWAGIILVPAAYLHFSDALLRSTGSTSRYRRIGVLVAYLFSAAAVALAASSELLL
ncbi:MAG: histidine kinase N-terminal 7TM domain-containing protein, partial [Anaerolineae bacterium]